MSVQRPTIHESWYRVRDLRVALRPSVQVQRQHFRGRPWRLFQDPASQDYFRLSEPGYRLVGLLDGSRTVEEAWRIVSEQLGDLAPTQGEAIRLLGQLWSSNLIAGDVPPDVQAMLRRQRVRRERELKGRLASLLSLRIPIFDPDRLLSGLAGPLGWLFSPVGLVLWMLLVVGGLWQIAGRSGAIAETAERALSPANLPWLYGSFVVLKILHELGHGLSCKVFGRREGSGGEVHAIGIMLLVLIPVPYVDATSAWGLRSKWRRIVVGASGMMVELVCAALAAWIWVSTREGSVVHVLAANTILVAGVSTLLFNGNPLLRYDGYYILSDLLEIPNLQQRARDALYSYVKLWLWGVRSARGALLVSGATGGERLALVCYALLASAYRLIVTVVIILFVSGQLFFIGVALGIMALLAWFVFPVVRFVHYLISSAELDRVRARAIVTSALAIAGVAVGLGVVPAPHNVRTRGLVESPGSVQIRMPESALLESIAPRGATMAAGDQIGIARSDTLTMQVAQWSAKRDEFAAEHRRARAEDPARAQIVREQLATAERELDLAQRRLAGLALVAGRGGVWWPDTTVAIPGAHLQRGEALGEIVDTSDLRARFEIDQATSTLLVGREGRAIELRPARGGIAPIGATIERIIDAGRSQETDRSGQTEERRIFEMFVNLDGSSATWLRPGLTVTGRVRLEAEPIGVLALRTLRRVLQSRFGL